MRDQGQLLEECVTNRQHFRSDLTRLTNLWSRPELERVSRTLDPDRVPELIILGSDEYLLGPRCSSLIVALLRMYLPAFLSGSPSLSPSLLSPSGTLPIGLDYDQYLSGQ